MLALTYSPAMSAQGLTDLEGFDSIWRDAEHAISHFFGPVDYVHTGATVELPQYADVGSSVALRVTIDCKMDENDYPIVAHVFAHGNPTEQVLSVWFTPDGGIAEFSTRIRLEQSQMVTLTVKMSDGRYIRIDREVTVSFGACGQVGTGDNDDIHQFQPKTKVRVQSPAKVNEVVPVRALISHPMETGMRYSDTHEWVRQRIIASFSCSYNGKVVFRARLYPAIATNPYFMCYLRATRSGEVTFQWYDTPQDIYFTDRAILEVI
jgi:thiosulfate oxidation carrier complex protein SoxZ